MVVLLSHFMIYKAEPLTAKMQQTKRQLTSKGLTADLTYLY